MAKRKGTQEAHHDESELMQLHGKRGGFGTFLYDKKAGLVMGRNGKEWCQLIIFYLIFYTFLIGFWSACLFTFLSTIENEKPKLTGYDSMLKLNPALGYRPQPDFESNLVKFNRSEPSTYATYVNDLNTFLAPYLDEAGQESLADCSSDGQKASKDQACKFVLSTMTPKVLNSKNLNTNEDSADSTANNNTYGFADGKPFIVLKMNRVYGWLPASKPNGEGLSDVRVQCFGENDADVETLGEISYYPKSEDGKSGIIPSYYFPFLNQPNYLSPLVFVHFKEMKPFTVALIWCELSSEDMTFGSIPFWSSRALNERAGGAHFEIVVDQ